MSRNSDYRLAHCMPACKLSAIDQSHGFRELYECDERPNVRPTFSPDEQLSTATIYTRAFSAYNEVKEFI